MNKINSKEVFSKKNKNTIFNVILAVKSYWPLKQELNIVLSICYTDINFIIAKFYKQHLDYDFNKDFNLISKRLILSNSNELEFKELYFTKDIEKICPEVLSIIKQNLNIFFEKYCNYSCLADEYIEDNNIEWYQGRIFALVALKISNDKRYICYKSELIKIIKKDSFDVSKRQSIQNIIQYVDKKYI